MRGRPTWQLSGIVLGFLLVAASPARDPLTAAKQQDWELLRELLDGGANPNAGAPDGTTALHWASYWDRLDAARLLIDAGADVNAETDLGVTPLWPAAQNGSAGMVDLLLKAGADPRATLPSGETLVMTAALTGNAEVVSRLLDAGGDPNGSGTRQQTALMWAAGEGHSEVVAVLLEHGADVSARTAVRRQYMKTEKEQESNPEYHVWLDMGGSTALMFAARSGHLEAAKHLVAAGADVNETNGFGITPIIMAVHGGNPELVAYLLEAGADPNLAEAGYSALHAAILHGSIASVEALLAHGADVNAPLERPTPTRRGSDDFHFHNAFVGATPFWLAARFTQPDVMRLLLEHGADPLFVLDCRYPAGDKENQWEEVEGPITTVMAAVGMGGVRINRGFHRPRGAELEQAMLEAVRIAAEAGVDIDATDALGQSALDHATIRGYEAVAEYLTQFGAKHD